MTKKKFKTEKLHLLQTLLTLSPQKQINIIKFLDSDGINILSEIVHNTIFKNLKLNTRQKKRLKEKILGKEQLLKFISKKSNKSISRKKKLLQTGGFLGTILGIAVPILADIVMNAVSK